jgi:hypothetical protein
MVPFRLPSADAVAAAAVRTVRRFPDVLLVAAAATVIAWRLVEADGTLPRWEAAMAAAALGLPLLLAGALLAEGHGWRGVRRTLPPLAGGALLAAFAARWPHWTQDGRLVRCGLAAAACHFAAAVAPFVARPDATHGRAFWQCNRVLFQRALLTALYGVVLFAGLGGALGALDALFDVNVRPDWYARLWVTLLFGFGTWFFLAGIPDPPQALGDSDEYPDALRRFAQYVLIPLVVVYLTILTAYFGKVLVTQRWPSGWIGNLVSAVTIAGLLAWLLVHPLEGQAAHRWVRPFTRGFFVALLPSIGMLWAALAQRVGQYGLTARRVIALAGALWLTGIALHYLRGRSRAIQLIPLSLALAAALLAAGPVSAIALAVHNQRGRVDEALARQAMRRDGRWVPARDTLAFRAAGRRADAGIIAGGVRYLADVEGADAFAALLPDSVLHPALADSTVGGDSLAVLGRRLQRPEALAERVLRYLGGDALAVASGEPARPVTADGMRGASFESGGALAVSGYDWVRQGGVSRGGAPLAVGGGHALRVSDGGDALELRRDSVVLVRLPVDTLLREVVAAQAAGDFTRRPPRALEGAAGSVRLRVLLEDVQFDWRGSAGRLANVGLTALLAAPSPPRPPTPPAAPVPPRNVSPDRR